MRLDRDRRVAEIVEQRIHPLLEQRQPMFHAGMAASLADGLIEHIVAFGRAELRDIAHPEPTDGLGDELEFRDRHQIERAHVEQRALGLGVERTDRFQGIAEEIETHGLLEPGRKQVEDAAAHGIFAGFAHRGGAAIAVMLQPGDDGIHRHDLAGRYRQRLRGDGVARRHPLHDGVHGRQHDQRLLAAGKPCQPRQRGQPLRQDSAMRRHPVIGLAVPGRKLHERQVRREKRKRAGQLLHARAVAADHRQADRGFLRPGRDSPRQIGYDEPFRTFSDIGKRQRAAGRQQFRGRFGVRLHNPSSTARNALMRSNSGPAYSRAIGRSPVRAA